MGDNASLQAEGFVSAEELEDSKQRGAVGELVGWAFDENGNYLQTGRAPLLKLTVTACLQLQPAR